MDAKDLERFRRLLRQQRQTLLREISTVAADLNRITEERESELEEQAQEERTARLLSRLDDREKAELAEIDRALARIEEGRYGRCQGCAGSISLQRLTALPATLYCRGCAERIEHGMPIEAAEPEALGPSSSLPPDYRLLTDRELEEAVRDQVREDGRIDSEELRIVCRHGVVYLGGNVPSEAERKILLRTVTDVMGLKDVIDRLGVTEILWEREDRSKDDVANEPKPWEEPQGTADLTEAGEEGVEFVPPLEPGPDEE